jgi:hypothetical protein
MLSSKFRFYRFNPDVNVPGNSISNLIKDARREYIESLKTQIQRNREQINQLTSSNYKR